MTSTATRTTGPRLGLAFALLALVLATSLPAHAAPDAADPAFWYATAPDGSARIRLHFFWTTRCPHCQAARPFVEGLPARLPYVDLVSHPTDGDASAARLQYATARALGADPTSVPAIFFCGESQIGYDDAATTGATLVQRLDACRARLAADPSLLARPIAVIAQDARAGGGGTRVALAIGAAFVGLIVLGMVLAMKSARAQERADAARRAHRGDGGKRRRH